MNTQPTAGGNITPTLSTTINRVEQLLKDKADISADIREVFAEAKGQGLDIPTVREILRLRKMDEADRQQQEHLRDVYLTALGLA